MNIEQNTSESDMLYVRKERQGKNKKFYEVWYAYEQQK